MSKPPSALRLDQGFTLIEVLVTVAIIGILASIAIPNYSAYVTRSKIQEATSALSDYRVRMEQYYQDNRRYAPTGSDAECGVPVPTGDSARYFAYSCVAANSGQSYTMTATGRATGGMNGIGYTVNQLNQKTSVLSAPGWTNPSPNNCWAIRQGGQC